MFQDWDRLLVRLLLELETRTNIASYSLLKVDP